MEASNGLFGWRQSALPEDPPSSAPMARRSSRRSPHERDAYLEISDAEYQRLVQEVPESREHHSTPNMRRDTDVVIGGRAGRGEARKVVRCGGERLARAVLKRSACCELRLW